MTPAEPWGDNYVLRGRRDGASDDDDDIVRITSILKSYI
jgi:hypothetical protein